MATCLKSIKSCLNSIKLNKDYEYVSYEQNNQSPPEINRNMNIIDPIQPIEYNKIETNINNNNFELKKQKAKVNLINQFNQQPKFQSTRIVDNNDYSSLHFLPCNKIVSSTMINTNNTNDSSLLTNDLTASQIDSTYYNSFTNSLYFSPPKAASVAPIKQDNSLISSDDETNQDTFDQSQSLNSFDSNQFHSVKSSFFNDKQDQENELFVCTIPYQAKFQGDLNTNYSDRVKLIHSNIDYCLVQNISTKQCGYIPKISIILLSNFLNQF
jgi:hypothetical protein